MVVSTVAVNLQDCPPLGSVHRADLSAARKSEWEKLFTEGVRAESNGLAERAIEKYREAARVDGSFAELHYRLAECYTAMGQLDEARQHYVQARDCDALQFRADSRINEMICGVASGREAEGILLVDTDRALGKSELAQGRLPGNDLFYDHVHFNFEGDYQVAKNLLPIVETALELRHLEAGIPSKEDCAASLAFTQWDELWLAEPMVQLRAQPPFVDQVDHAGRQARAERNFASREQHLGTQDPEAAIGLYRRATSRRPDDWQLSYNFGRLLLKLKRYDQAAHQFENALRLFPNLLQAEIGIGDSLLEAGRVEEAVQHFVRAVQIDPHSKLARRALARALPAPSAARNPASEP
jgi:tetratricopeptide (TPR) repeat protein